MSILVINAGSSSVKFALFGFEDLQCAARGLLDWAGEAQCATVSITPREEFCMHARPLSLIAKVAIHYNTPLEIEIEGKSCNAGSIMQMILIAGDNPRPSEILFRGEERALNDVKDLFALGFLDQIACEEVPHHLQYLFK